jgi:predicted nucleic acid-binding protein
MSAIADTSPLNYLARLNCCDILEEIYGAVLAPEAVLSELSHAGSPPEVRALVANAPHWLQTVRVDKLDVTLPANLGAGEREAISFAQLSPGRFLLIDDRDGRLAAVERNIEIAGTMTVLSEAALRRRLDFSETISRLKTLGFRISADHESAILERHTEKLRRMRLS